MALRVQKFNPCTMKESRITFIVGKRGTGKSVVLMDLLYNMPRPDYVLAMCPTETSLALFRTILPETSIFDHFNQEKLERVVTLQKELVSRGKKRTVLIILDDCMYNKAVLKSMAMREIFYNGRHEHIGMICAAQYMMEIDISLRSNIDYLFSMRENVLVNRQKLHKYLFGQFATFASFDKVMRACTQDFKALVLDATLGITENPTDNVMWYKASQELPAFRMCRPIYWSWSERYCLSDDAIRRAQRRQFEIQTAVMEAETKSGGCGGGGGGGGVCGGGGTAASKSRRKGDGFDVVQTEDENGELA